MKKMMYGILGMTCLITLLVAMPACSSSDPEPTPVAPTVKITHSISGMVTAVNGSAISGADVTAELGTAKFTAKTGADGTFVIQGLEGAGEYAMKVDASGKVSVSGTATIEVSTTNPQPMVAVFNAVMSTYVAPTTVEPAKETVVEVKTEASSENVASEAKVSVTIPENAVTEAKQVTITPVAAVEAPVKLEGSTASTDVQQPTLATLVCEPTGLTFAKPVEIKVENKMKGAAYKNVSLYYLDNGVWTKQTNKVTLTNGGYTTEITHFSAYQFAPQGDVTSKESHETLTMPNNATVDNTAGSVTVTMTDINYTQKFGYEFTTSPADALKAIGITDAETVSSFAQTIVNALNSAKLSSQTAVYKGATGTEVPRGTKVVVTATQDFDTITYKYVFTVNGADKTATVVAKKYGKCNFKVVSTVTQQHSGGSSN